MLHVYSIVEKPGKVFVKHKTTAKIEERKQTINHLYILDPVTVVAIRGSMIYVSSCYTFSYFVVSSLLYLFVFKRLS